MVCIQKILDEHSKSWEELYAIGYKKGCAKGRTVWYAEGYAEGYADGLVIGYAQLLAAVEDAVDPVVIAERFKISFEQVMKILGQNQ